MCTPGFSFIMPTYNRAFCICNAIDSVLAQNYDNLELIIVDDGSTDGTEELIKKKYLSELSSGKIRYVFGEHKGVCPARNVGLKNARKEWIAYIDSDNTIVSDFIQTYRKAMRWHPWKKIFYAQYKGNTSGIVSGKKFSRKSLIKGNYIDMGALVHAREVYEKLGGFDESLTRLVDYDLVLTYTEHYKPYFIKKVVVHYNDAQDHKRISNTGIDVAIENAKKIIAKHFSQEERDKYLGDNYFEQFKKQEKNN